MSQNLFNQIDPTVTDGNELARLLNEQRNVVASQSAGSKTPSWATYGTTWVDSSDPANPVLMISNGDKSVQVGNAKNNGTPLGVVAAWAGAAASIPTGWAICDGTLYGEVQSPDLRDKFIVGAGGASNPSEVGGGDTAAGDAGLEFMALCYIIKITGDLGDGPMGPPGTPGKDGISVPIGGIIMWTDSVIPANWALCDGSAVNGITTPNLTSKFIVGAGPSHPLKSTGGYADATLPEHGHSAVLRSTRAVASGETAVAGNHGHNGNFQVNDPGHSHMSPGRGAPNGGGDGSAFTTNGPSPGHSTNHVYTGINISGGTDWQGDHTHSFTVSIDVGGGPVTVQPEGADPTGKNLPPFYALSYIMRVA